MKITPSLGERFARSALYIVIGSALLLGQVKLRAANLTAASESSPRVQSLDGEWQLAQDLYDHGLSQSWFDPAKYPAAEARPIQVPGNVTETWPNRERQIHKAANLTWYYRTFTPSASVGEDLRSYLRFGAVRFASEIWLNGSRVGTHEGGEDPFEFDITDRVKPGQPNTIIVRVTAPWFGGINQHVSIVAQPRVRIIDGFAQPDIKAHVIKLEVTLENTTSTPAEVSVDAVLGEFKSKNKLGTKSANITARPGRSVITLSLPVEPPHLWSPDDPFLYTIKIGSHWAGATRDAAGKDEYSLRTGFRDFRIVDGYFQLNGKRLFVKATHMNWYDPVVIQGTPRTMEYLNQDIPLLKKAGFNMMRFILSAALPEQLEQADELGLLVYSEHDSSWLIKDASEFGFSLNGVVRRDRNHPSLVIWGLLNETSAKDIYERARGWLPAVRGIDPTRLVLLSSGRWDEDFRTGSASNPGASTWNIYLGGEDPIQPVTTGKMVEEIGAFHAGTGDAHIYHRYPTSWAFVNAFAQLARDTKPFFLSEAGIGSSYNAIAEDRKMQQAKAPDGAYAYLWIKPAVAGLKKSWHDYGLHSVYPKIEDMMTDSALATAHERALIFSLVRANPKVNGYSLTSQLDTWGAGEGFMDNFREYKPGHLETIRAGWAPLRWCLFVNPTNVYSDQPIQVRVSLANEDQLAAGDYPATLKISGPKGIIWTVSTMVHIAEGPNAPLAYSIYDDEVRIPDLVAGDYTLEATLKNKVNAAANIIPFVVTQRDQLPQQIGAVTAIGVGPQIRELLTRQGAQLRDFGADQPDREVIVVGDDFPPKGATWRALYGHVARGAQVIFLSAKVFQSDRENLHDLKWLAVKKRGAFITDRDWLYHKDIIAKNVSAFAGLPSKLMTPLVYSTVLSNAGYFADLAIPDETAAVAIRCTFNDGFGLDYKDGVVLGTYRYHEGRFTINGLNLLQNIGNPAADRIILNLISAAKSAATPLRPMPTSHEAEMDVCGIHDKY